jgi:hypothetical protein
MTLKSNEMANRFWLIFLLLLTGTSILKAQTSSYMPSDFYNSFLGSKFGKIVNANTEIKGSPYENDEFIPGEVYAKDRKHYTGIPLRVNIYSDQAEFKNPEGGIYEVSKPDIIDSILIGTSKYMYQPFKTGSKTRNGFFKVLACGTPQLLLKMNVILNPAEPASTYKDALPATFERTADDFYLLFPQGEVLRFSGKKDFLEMLGSFQQEMEQFIKKNKIRFYQQDDLITAMKYYYSLGK